jgi:BolA protein
MPTCRQAWMPSPVRRGASATPAVKVTHPIHQSPMNRRERIQERLQDRLTPLHMEVVDESHMHSVPEGAESHFKVVVVSDRFSGSKLLARHRLVNDLLRDELASGLHALALHTWTPEEWFEKGGSAPESPPCLGGSKSS